MSAADPSAASSRRATARSRPIRARRSAGKSVDLLAYKSDAAAPFRDVTRQTLFKQRRPRRRAALLRGRAGRALDARAPRARARRADPARPRAVPRRRRRAPVGEHDLVTVPPKTWHQFRAAKDAPLGFLCMVDAVRDKAELPDDAVLETMRAQRVRPRLPRRVTCDRPLSRRHHARHPRLARRARVRPQGARDPRRRAGRRLGVPARRS